MISPLLTYTQINQLKYLAIILLCCPFSSTCSALRHSSQIISRSISGARSPQTILQLTPGTRLLSSQPNPNECTYAQALARRIADPTLSDEGFVNLVRKKAEIVDAYIQVQPVTPIKGLLHAGKKGLLFAGSWLSAGVLTA